MDDVVSQLENLVKVAESLRKTKRKDDVVLDFSLINFLHPLFIGGLSGLCLEMEKKGITVRHDKASASVGAYLDVVRFPEGFKPDELTDWQTSLGSYEIKSYLPMINFPASKAKKKTEVREAVLSAVNSLFKRKLKLNTDYYSAISYLISELTDNIVDHSGSNRGVVVAQHYGHKGYLDICILDRGKTILGSYAKRPELKVRDDVQAVYKALSGVSTKSKERG